MREQKVLGINLKNGKPFLVIASNIICIENIPGGSRVHYIGGYIDVDKDNDWFKKFLTKDYEYSSCREI